MSEPAIVWLLRIGILRLEVSYRMAPDDLDRHRRQIVDYARRLIMTATDRPSPAARSDDPTSVLRATKALMRAALSCQVEVSNLLLFEVAEMEPAEVLEIRSLGFRDFTSSLLSSL